MKAITFIFLLISFSISFTQAQHTFGVQGGVSFSNILTQRKSIYPPDYRVGHVYKINYEYNFWDRISFATGVIFQDKGFTNEIDIITDLKVNELHRYISIPVGFGLRAGDQIYGKFLIQASFGFLILHHSNTMIYQQGNLISENNWYNTDQYTPFDFSINPSARIGYRFDNGFSIFIDGSFAVSVTGFSHLSYPANAMTNNYAFSACVGIDYMIRK